MRCITQPMTCFPGLCNWDMTTLLEEDIQTVSSNFVKVSCELCQSVQFVVARCCLFSPRCAICFPRWLTRWFGRLFQHKRTPLHLHASFRTPLHYYSRYVICSTSALPVKDICIYTTQNFFFSISDLATFMPITSCWMVSLTKFDIGWDLCSDVKVMPSKTNSPIWDASKPPSSTLDSTLIFNPGMASITNKIA